MIDTAGTAERHRTRYALTALAAVALASFAIRLAGLPDLLDNEHRLGTSVLDAIHAGHWLCPLDALGHIDKPPMLTWLAAIASLLAGRVTPFTLYLPTALATLALAWLVFAAGRRYFGWRAGVLGGLAYLLSEVGTRQIASARWDGLFTLTVAATAFAAFHAWTTGRGWLWFWLAAAAATLTKGPLGLLLGGMGLLAAPWERWRGTPAPLRGRQLPGLAVYLLVTLGWFWLAYRQIGPSLVDMLIRNELVSHAIEHAPGRRFMKPPGDFLENFAPWSLATVVGLVRVVRTPAAGDGPRRFERFVWCWFMGGLLVFCLSPHTAARLLYPVIPPAALLAGRELALLTRRLSATALAAACVTATVAGLAGAALYYGHLVRKDPDVRNTIAMQELADEVQRTVGMGWPLTYVDAPIAFQLIFNTMRPPVSFKQAAALLAGDTPAYVVVQDLARLDAAMGDRSGSLTQVATVSVDGHPYLHIVANRQRLERTAAVATDVGPVRVELVDADLAPAPADEVAVRRRGLDAAVTLENRQSTPTTVRVRFPDLSWLPASEQTLAPGERRHLTAP